MRRCFELARKGLGFTRTNPLVGSVIVHNDRIIGEGYHHEFGGPHAEVNAIRSVRDPSLLPDSILYCNLEPCAHHGKTPPCSMMIQQKGIRKVVISNTDPFPSVNGQGVRQMEQAGITVKTGCLEEEGCQLNRRFFHFHNMKRPYVILKWAQTQDKFMDVVRDPGDPIGTNWITDEVSRTLTHKWRSEEGAIMVGTNTVITDNPRLNVRRWTGDQPVRITFDRKGKISPDAHILDGSHDTLVFTGVPGKYSGRTRSLHVDPSYDIDDLMQELYDQHIISVFVEGGARLHDSFLQSGLWDEARIFTGKMSFSQGVKAPVMKTDPIEKLVFNETVLEVFINHNRPFH
ncbi:MAG: bifunctional diaminohydroxyphosphoribosylaminopyrimidine deaminase/5-amino-6-(5-phosphoribosylamino)uracil reductase RibD [Bacteroidetes bacterium]|nr:bifunctional diaminohydroxyphosphoribosylaminopyrimidine deaminase/5-amino-6-(5-phosphoribosylamino)uracil reductase RibD [Bacteroidota bacterium]